jgi:hypothetical protein
LIVAIIFLQKNPENYLSMTKLQIEAAAIAIFLSIGIFWNNFKKYIFFKGQILNYPKKNK